MQYAANYELIEIETCNLNEIILCICGKVGVDGGHEYLRRIGSIGDYEELSEWLIINH